MVLRNIVLAGAWILRRLDHPDQLHHTSILVREDVAVQDVGAGKVYELVPDADSPRYDLPVDADGPGGIAITSCQTWSDAGL